MPLEALVHVHFLNRPFTYYQLQEHIGTRFAALMHSCYYGYMYTSTGASNTYSLLFPNSNLCPLLPLITHPSSREELVLQLKQEVALLNAEAERNKEQVSEGINVIRNVAYSLSLSLCLCLSVSLQLRLQEFQYEEEKLNLQEQLQAQLNSIQK